MTDVVVIINALTRGGGERMVRNFVPRLRDHGRHVTVLCLYHGGPLADELEAEGIPVRVLRISKRVRLPQFASVLHAIAGLRPRIVHCVLTESMWLGLPAAFLARVPIRIAHYQNAYRSFPRRLRILDRTAARFATGAIACSESVSAFLHQGGYPRRPVAVIPNATYMQPPVRPRAATRAELRVGDEERLVLTVASLTPQKGHAVLLEAARTVVEWRPSVKFVLAGSGPLEAALRETAVRHGVERHVAFLGDRSDVPDLLAAADLFVLPSFWEGLPLVLVEALLAGVPAIATAVDGSAEVLADGAGMLVPPGSPEALAGAIRHLLEHPADAAAMSRRGRAGALARYEADGFVQQLQRFYDTQEASGTRRLGDAHE